MLDIGLRALSFAPMHAGEAACKDAVVLCCNSSPQLAVCAGLHGGWFGMAVLAYGRECAEHIPGEQGGATLPG